MDRETDILKQEMMKKFENDLDKIVSRGLGTLDQMEVYCFSNI
jgi:hypothetical protein